MCPIVGLTDATPSFKEIGRLRLGTPKSAGFPKEIHYFRADFRPDAADAFAAFVAAYGNNPTQINIRFPFNEIHRCWDAYYEVYNTAGMLGKADGVKWLYLRDNKTGALLVKDGIPSDATGLPVDENGMAYMPFDKSMPVYAYKSKKGEDVAVFARPTGRLNVLIPELRCAAYVQVITNSIYNCARLSAQFGGIAAVAKNLGITLSMVPMVLSRRKESISVTISGKKSMQEHYLLNVEIDPAWSNRYYLLTPGDTAPTVPLPALPADVDAGDLSEEEPLPPDSIEEQADLSTAEPETHGDQPPLNGSSRPYAPEVLKARLVERTIAYTGKTASQKQRNLVAILFSQIFSGPDEQIQRHAVQKYLFGASSLHDVSDAFILVCLNDWLKPTADSGGEYQMDHLAVKESLTAYQAAVVAQGQSAFPL